MRLLGERLRQDDRPADAADERCLGDQSDFSSSTVPSVPDLCDLLVDRTLVLDVLTQPYLKKTNL